MSPYETFKREEFLLNLNKGYATCTNELVAYQVLASYGNLLYELINLQFNA